jgi:hypothetical protein
MRPAALLPLTFHGKTPPCSLYILYIGLRGPAPLRHMQLGKPTLSPHVLDPQVICLNIPLTLASFHLELEAQ